MPPTAKLTLAEAERDHILGALRETGWVVGGPEGGRGPPGDETFDVVLEDEEARHLPTGVAPLAIRQKNGGKKMGEEKQNVRFRSW